MFQYVQDQFVRILLSFASKLRNVVNNHRKTHRFKCLSISKVTAVFNMMMGITYQASVCNPISVHVLINFLSDHQQ
jgi:hypothetical protein